MNTRQKKKHDYYFNLIKGLDGYPRHQFVKRRGFLLTGGYLRKLYKIGEYWVCFDPAPSEEYLDFESVEAHDLNQEEF